MFTTDNQAGTVGLLTVGAISLLLAVVGRVPLRWVIGGSEFDMTKESAEATADAVASQLSPASTAKVAASLALSDASRSTVDAMMNLVAFEQSAIEKIGSVAEARGWSFAQTLENRTGLDGVVRNSDGGRVGVVLKLARRKSSLLAWLNLFNNSNLPFPIVLVVSGLTSLQGETRQALERHYQRGDFEMVDLDGAGFESRFRDACDRAFANAAR